MSDEEYFGDTTTDEESEDEEELQRERLKAREAEKVRKAKELEEGNAIIAKRFADKKKFSEGALRSVAGLTDRYYELVRPEPSPYGTDPIDTSNPYIPDDSFMRELDRKVEELQPQAPAVEADLTDTDEELEDVDDEEVLRFSKEKREAVNAMSQAELDRRLKTERGDIETLRKRIFSRQDRVDATDAKLFETFTGGAKGDVKPPPTNMGAILGRQLIIDKSRATPEFLKRINPYLATEKDDLKEEKEKKKKAEEERIRRKFYAKQNDWRSKLSKETFTRTDADYDEELRKIRGEPIAKVEGEYEIPPSPTFQLEEDDVALPIKLGLRPPVEDFFAKPPRPFDYDPVVIKKYNEDLLKRNLGQGVRAFPPKREFKKSGNLGYFTLDPTGKIISERPPSPAYDYENPPTFTQEPVRVPSPLDLDLTDDDTSTLELVRPPNEVVSEDDIDPITDDEEDFLKEVYGVDSVPAIRPDAESRAKMGQGGGKEKKPQRIKFPPMPAKAYEFTTEGKSYGEDTKSFLEQQRDAMLKMRTAQGQQFTSMFPTDVAGQVIEAKKILPWLIEEEKQKAKDKAEERKARNEAQKQKEYEDDPIRFIGGRKEFNRATKQRRRVKKTDDDLSKTPRFGVKRKKKKASPPPSPPPSPAPVAPPRKRRGLKKKSPKPPPKPKARPPPPTRPPPRRPPPKRSGVAPPTKVDRQRVRQRAQRSDKGKHHKWKDGRENTDTYKKNKAKGVDWSAVRCRASTCWNVGDRLTDTKGKGAYKKNKARGEYKGQLRKPKV